MAGKNGDGPNSTNGRRDRITAYGHEWPMRNNCPAAKIAAAGKFRILAGKSAGALARRPCIEIGDRRDVKDAIRAASNIGLPGGRG